jgi:hypothetical protein
MNRYAASIWVNIFGCKKNVNVRARVAGATHIARQSIHPHSLRRYLPFFDYVLKFAKESLNKSTDHAFVR